MRALPFLLATILACASTVTGMDDEPFFSARMETIASESRTPQEQEALANVRILAIEGSETPLKKLLRQKLDSAGISMSSPGCPQCAVKLTISRNKDITWRVIASREYSFMGEKAQSRAFDQWVVQADYEVTLSIPGSAVPMISYTALITTEWKLTNEERPDIPNEDSVATTLAPIVAGMIGHMDLLESMLNASKGADRKKAIEWLETIGHPAAVEILKKRLEVEKKRRIKGKLKKLIKKLEGN